MTSTVNASAATTSPARGLVCRACGAEYPIAAQHACYECFGPLEVAYDQAALARVTRDQIEAGPPSIWRYAGLLPTGQDPAARITLNPGYTPLVRTPELAAAIGLTAPLWVKDDSANPTHSFKDRVVSVALTAARGLGFTRFACASTGNLANSVAAHAARAGAPSVVFIPGDLERGKIVTTAVYGGDLVAIDGSYDDVNRLCGELVETDEFEDTAFVNVNVRPFYAEGSKTLGYEVAEQLGWRIPAQVIIPMASGELLTKVDKAFSELVEIGLAEAPDDGWRVFGAQSAGCNPIAAALQNGSDRIVPVKPTGIAKSLNIGDPAAGAYAIEAVQRTGWLDGRRRRRRDPRRHPPAGADHRRVRRDGRWRDGRRAQEAGGRRQAGPGGGDGRLQHRRRAQDPGRGRRSGRSQPPDQAIAARRPGGWPAGITVRSG
jgi:threonine synthase